MAITPEQKRIIEEHIRERGIQPCPICAATEWEVLQDFVAPQIWNPEPEFPVPGMLARPQLGQRALPMAVVVCTRCFFSAQFPWLLIQRQAAAKKAE